MLFGFLRYINLLFIPIFISTGRCAVQPPNYDFSLKSLELFRPGNDRKSIEMKYGQGERLEKNKVFYSIKQLRYKFPIIVQYRDDKVVDYFARFPNYFLHDVFLQTLYNKLGPQDQYFRLEEQAVYIWKNKDNIRYIYSGACSITCFPIWLSAILNQPGFSPQVDQMLILKNKKQSKAKKKN